MNFANPEALVLLLLVPLVLWWSLRPRQRGTARFSHLGMAARLPWGWAVHGPALLSGLRILVLVLLIVALARPQTADARVQTHTEGIAIQLVIDNSFSMSFQDYDQGAHSISRLEAVKHAVRLFVAGGQGDLQGRPNDKIGIISFARDPDVVCPLTLDHQTVLRGLDSITYAPPVGTNIGDALAWGLDRLRHDPARQKVLILLSDGAHNIKDSLPPLEAARLAADLKIKVYTIGAVGNRFGQPQAVLIRMPDGRQHLVTEETVDEPMMRKIAAQTGGQYFRATDTNGLLSIYREIDRLETTRIDSSTTVSFREWFLVLVIAALGLLALEQSLAATRLLRVP
jgi:Ca-activated chloride channel family protein